MAHHKNLPSEMRECIAHCQDCSAICLETLQHCLTLGGEHAGAEHIGLLMNCSSICRTSAEFMLTGSKLHHRICEVCSEICRQCAEDCRAIGPNDETMKQCASTCEQCAEHCQRMAGVHATS